MLPGVLLLGDLGVAAIGTLVAALAVRTRARDLLGPLLALPLLVPVVIGGARATAPLLVLAHPTAPGLRWPLALALYDLVFGLIAYAVFDFPPGGLMGREGGRPPSRPPPGKSVPDMPSTRSPAPRAYHGKGLRALSAATVVAMAAALALVFFYAPLEAEQGFLQKIFYVHVPLAIVALCGFVLGGVLAIAAPVHARRSLGHALLRGDPHEPDLRRRHADHRLDLGAAARGGTGGCGASPRSCPS